MNTMSLSKSASLVRQAENARPVNFSEALSPSVLRKSAGLESASTADPDVAYGPWAQALKAANDHITVRPEEIAAAADAYKKVANILVDRMRWPDHAINIYVQGSASTKTLIRSVFGNEKFDIDAVCAVDISRIHARDPMGFFQSVGNALQKLEAEAKKRCWTVQFPGEKFYVEFTPSVPLATIPTTTLDAMAPRYRTEERYGTTALAVVDTPTEKWKTSNPAGMTKWVDDTSLLKLVRTYTFDTAEFAKAAARVAPVPVQRVAISDTLRIAIRLFKRHRDMSIRRGIITKEFAPISIIIVTLLTQCYEGMAELGHTYGHPVELLAAITSLLPYLVLPSGGQYYVMNPTVEGENFAEKWNTDDGKRFHAFRTWCHSLDTDMKAILEEKDPRAIDKRVREVFGIPAPTSDGSSLSPTTFVAPPPTPAGRGLA